MVRITRGHLALVVFTFSVFGAGSASGQTINEDRKLTANDAEAFDSLGTAVAISGSTAIIGASFDEIGGSAYLFDYTTGQQLYKLKALDPSSSDRFGDAVAMSGTIAVIGAPLYDNNNGNGADAGAAYIFDTSTGEQLFKLLPSDGRPFDNFGSSVAISGTTAIIGAPGDDEGRGSFYTFNTVTGEQMLKITPNDRALFDRFGTSLAVSGTTVIVGSPRDDDVVSGSGSVYLFNMITGLQLSKLHASDPGLNDEFGNAVAISGTTAIIGAHLDDPTGGSVGSNTGSAYIFDTTSGQQLFKLTASDAEFGDVFGYAVSISGTTAIVGAYLNSDPLIDNGSVYGYDTATGMEVYRFVASDPENNDRLGETLVISGSTVIACARQDDDGGVNSGSAYVFDIGASCAADLTGDGVLNFFDVSAFLVAFNAQDPVADFTGDGLFNFFDVSAFLVAYSAGCP